MPARKVIGRHKPQTRVRLAAASIGVVLLSGTLSAWQLAPRTLVERVSDADIIVVGSVEAIHSRAPSPIAGVGDVWLVTLRVSKALKGRLPVGARITFADVAVEDQRAFLPSQERIWLLKNAAEPTLLSASSAYQSVLPAAEEARIRAALQQSPAPTTPHR